MDPFGRDPAEHGLEPALELRSYLAEVKPIAPGESAGYGRRFVARAPTWIGTVPIGYGDGVRRALTNDCDVLVDGRRVPLVGTVSMDNITVDLGPEPPRARRRGRPDRRAGRRARARGGVGAAARDDQLRDHVRDQRARAAGVPPQRRRRAGRPPRDGPRAARRGPRGARRARRLDRRRRRARPAARPRDDRPRPRRSRTTPGRPRARSRARRAAPPSGSRARSAPGASSGPSTPGTSTS